MRPSFLGPSANFTIRLEDDLREALVAASMGDSLSSHVRAVLKGRPASPELAVPEIDRQAHADLVELGAELNLVVKGLHGGRLVTPPLAEVLLRNLEATQRRLEGVRVQLYRDGSFVEARDNASRRTRVEGASRTYTFRLEDLMREELEQDAVACGLSLSSYVREVLHGRTPPPVLQVSLLNREAWGDLGRHWSNLFQLEKKLRQKHLLAPERAEELHHEIERTQRLLVDVRVQLFGGELGDRMDGEVPL